MPLRGSWPAFLLRGLAQFLLADVLFLGLWPWLMQQLIVSPNELARERPYLAHTIAFTQAAYKLQNIEKKSYSPTGRLGPRALEDNRPTIANIRLWHGSVIIKHFASISEAKVLAELPRIGYKSYRPDSAPPGRMPLEAFQHWRADRETRQPKEELGNGCRSPHWSG